MTQLRTLNGAGQGARAASNGGRGVEPIATQLQRSAQMQHKTTRSCMLYTCTGITEECTDHVYMNMYIHVVCSTAHTYISHGLSVLDFLLPACMVHCMTSLQLPEPSNLVLL